MKNKTPSWDSGFRIEQATLNKEIRKGLAKEVAFKLTYEGAQAARPDSTKAQRWEGAWGG